MATTRRTFLARSLATTSAVAAAGSSLAAAADAGDESSRQASGVKVGEVSANSAIVWTRLTREARRAGPMFRVEGNAKTPEKSLPAPVEQLEGACPGAAGQVRVQLAVEGSSSPIHTTPWVAVDAATDFTHAFQLTSLTPGTLYHYKIETRGMDGAAHGPVRGKFRTAPLAEQPTNVRLGFINCQKFHSREQDDGFHIYESILKREPTFVVFTGDNVYYDSDRPRAMSAELARYHWQRCYSLPRHRKLLESTSSYWLKDDHDVHSDDAYPQRSGNKMGEFTFAQGMEIYRQQVPLSTPYRTFRWGRDLQIWLVEGRDFRSSNSAPDGPEKSIWGTEQKAWLKQTMQASDATWKLLLSPTPLVGPDRKNKADNHSNETFAHEGNEMRQWFSKQLGERFFVVTGDRHWQYHSVDPATGLNEFSIGAASAGNAGGTPGYDPTRHKFHLVQGGFLGIDVSRKGNQSQLTFELCNVQGKVAYRHTVEATPS